MNQLIDGYQRKIDYIRLSLTDQCNFQCFYCRPKKMEKTFLPDRTYLNTDDIDKLFYVLGKMGVKKVKLTGGEPLLRKDICDVVSVLSKNPFLTDISLTTNGFFLEKLAKPLKDAGLSRINISLDSLKEDVFYKITKTPTFTKVWAGILKALDVGFKAIKLNVVLIKGMNDSEVIDFAALSTKYPIVVRFIEFMPTKRTELEQKDYFFSNDNALSKMREHYSVVPELTGAATGPSRYYAIDGGQGRVGFISPLSHNFCEKCNRVRISAKGSLRLCLFSENEHSLLADVRAKDWESRLEAVFMENMKIKPLRHDLENRKMGNVESFVNIGG